MARPGQLRGTHAAAWLAAMFLAGCGGAANLTPAPATPQHVTVTPAPHAAPVPTRQASPLVTPAWKWEIRGNGDFDTSSIVLAAGTYRVDWAKEPGCTLSGTLKPAANPNQAGGPSLGGSNADGPTKWTTYISGVAAGQYVARVVGSCAWSVILTRP